MKEILTALLLLNGILVMGLHAAAPVGNGDANGDGLIDISDAVYLLSGLFLGGPQPVAIECLPPGHLPADGPSGNGDLNGDRTIDISDAVYLLSGLFTGGPAPKEIRCQPATTGKPLPDTGQVKCYGEVEGEWIEQPCESTICTGQDGGYSTGCPMDGRFVDNGDGTVTDKCTGLMWQKETADIDRDGQIGDGDRNYLQGALIYCESLTFAGHDDWRLPNVRELQSIVDYGRSNPAIDSVFGSVSDRYISSTGGIPALFVYFDNGGVIFGGDAFGGGSGFVRAVRGDNTLPATGQTKCYDAAGTEIDCTSTDFPGQDGFYQAGCPNEGRFVDNGDGTVTDNCTGLMWQKETADVNGVDGNDTLRWCDALAYCEELVFAGYDDWRLPNVLELHSFVYVGNASDDVKYWSSSTIIGFPGDAWNLGQGFTTKGYYYFVRAVRNAP